MTAPNREQFKNNATTTLNGSITNVATSITVTDGSVFPTSGNFRLICESEIMTCTARSTNTLTVVRGQESTTGAAHADLVTITLILTADSFDRGGKDNVPLWGESTFPPLNKIVGTDGATILTSSDFTWQNQGTASVADLAGTMALRAVSSAGNNFRSLLRSTPSAPWTVIAAVSLHSMVTNGGNSNPQAGLVLRESSTSKLISFGVNRQGTVSMRFAVDRWTNDTTFAGTSPWLNTNPIFHGNLLWLKLNDNNTNLIYSMSNDGVEWIQVLSESRTAHMAGAPNQFGVTVNNGGDSTAKDFVLRLYHWHSE